MIHLLNTDLIEFKFLYFHSHYSYLPLKIQEKRLLKQKI